VDEYFMIDVNVFQENIFHTKCKLKHFDLDNYFFNFSVEDISTDEITMITGKLRKEMDEVFYGKNMPDKG
jgi:S-adenosylmethionine decarboxylase